ncbi:A/G-specific adenine glycosylase [Brachybacterium sp. AOP25-B2-12]|uniref:A/G-specific adenine glycosylase n=1 Tax=Brachybacterium sp. AOP25-B2-12 TaxID=3457710 RepID=UPI004034D3D7
MSSPAATDRTSRAADAAPAPTGLPLGAIDAVLDWYDRCARDLPWRHPGTSAWAVLVSEIMLQQTPVVRVLPRWTAWMRRWPEPADLAAAPTADVLRMWDSLGYPRRALRLQECARSIVERHGGQVPDDAEELRALPGIGEYTAAAVGAFAFGRRTVVADTNVRRVIVRDLSGARYPATSYTAAERRHVTACVPAAVERSVRWNQAVMELGALVCTARSPRCEECPLREVGCAFHDAGRPEHAGPPRRRQGFEGTDRQLRGRIMAALRAHGSTSRASLEALDPEDPDRVERCVRSLVTDGLAVELDGCLDLPA